ncbi:putative procollagen-proline 4-dioxygenase [Helianthus debilis subsp. tardiflorus]
MYSEYGEGFQVLRYEVGQKFGIHYDYPIGEHFTKDGGHTVATIVIYLSDVEEGGEEVFPLAKGNISALACGMENIQHMMEKVVEGYLLNQKWGMPYFSGT